MNNLHVKTGDNVMIISGKDKGHTLNDDQTKVVIDENQNFKDAFQYYTDLTLKYKVTPTVEQDTALGGYQRWLDGQVAFYACGTVMLKL